MNWSLLIQLVGYCIVVACILAGINAYLTFYHGYRMSEPDEFQDLDDPYAISISTNKVRIFQSVASLHRWICENCDDSNVMVHMYLQAIIAKENTGLYRLII